MTPLTASPPATPPSPGTCPHHTCPHHIARPLMSQRWEQLTFLHWRCDPAEVQRLLPAGLEVDLAESSAWVTLVPFVLHVGPGPVDSMRWLGNFAETNVRTYVRDRHGRPGISFLSLDAPRLAAVLGARTYHGLPYQWSKMSFNRQGSRVHYECRRRWPDTRGARSTVSIEVGRALADSELSDLDHFLTARWALFAQVRGRLLRTDAEHAPWPLKRAHVLHLDDELVAAAGLAVSGEPELVHFSESVRSRLSTPHLVK